ncbi:HAMP domain-containing sensor histidine kinase [Olsenella sp. An270]|uniref:sensor histidine kinase n=1 Tax=Olsenella sp. An270 TaxID=1965615 RepID=UPI000B37B2E4|nr:HAMP domain-containing sensor histidine kinase [Olsenella sp. An270]
MLLRNAEVRRTVFAFLAVGVTGAGAAWALAGVPAAVVVAATVAVLLGVFLVSTRLRYRRIARMASQVDAVLHGERDVSFERMREGELAVLASELDKMRSRLELANEDLLREKNALADALADVSHQIKTPLTSLSLMTSLTRGALVENGGHPGEVERLRTMERLEGRVEWLVSSLLKLARIDAGVVSFSRVHVDGAELVERAAEPLAVAFDLADVELAREVQVGSGFEGDLAWTAEALENILKNCLEHTPAGGCVSVTVTEDALAFRLRVEDTGPGIAEGDLPHVFERFWRGGEKGEGAGSSEVDPGGVGIGLALAKSLVTAQGGSIRAGNAPGGGARFDLVFFKATV